MTMSLTSDQPSLCSESYNTKIPQLLGTKPIILPAQGICTDNAAAW